MALATRTAKHWHEVNKVEKDLVKQLEDARVRLGLECAQIQAQKPYAVGKEIRVSVLIDCTQCEKPISAETALLLDIV